MAVKKFTPEQRLAIAMYSVMNGTQKAARKYHVTPRAVEIWRAKAKEDGYITSNRQLSETIPDNVEKVAQELDKKLGYDAESVLEIELSPGSEGHLNFIKLSMTARQMAVKKIIHLIPKAKSLKELSATLAVLNSGIETFSAAVPISNMQQQDEMWMATTQVLQAKRALDAERKKQENTEETEYEAAEGN